MQTETFQLVQAIHDHPSRLVMVTAGAGTQALSDLLGVAGATRTLLEALVPYSEASFDEYLEQKPSQYVAIETARLLAGRSLTRARWLDSGKHPNIGLSCTATIVTDRPKRGDHRAHIAIWQPARLNCYSIYLEKGTRNRAGEEDVVSRVMLNGLAQACNLDLQLPVPLVAADNLEVEECDFEYLIGQLQEGAITHFSLADNGDTAVNKRPPPILFSGAYNPLHEGHLALAKVAGTLLNQDVAFELSVDNADKPPLAADAALERIAQFAGRYSIFASNAPTFVQKAQLYPGTTFLVGYDTAVRILHPHYYGNGIVDLENALNEIGRQSCRFLVAGRAGQDGQFRQVEDLAIPKPFLGLFQGIPRELFRKDVSSTELRRTGRKGSR